MHFHVIWFVSWESLLKTDLCSYLLTPSLPDHFLQHVTDCSNPIAGTQYLFLPPNRYIFHGAEVYSDSEDDIISSSSCGSSSESGSCRSQSLDVEDESEMEEFYNGIEDEDAPEREEEPAFGADGEEQEELAAEESAEAKEAAGTEHPSRALWRDGWLATGTPHQH